MEMPDEGYIGNMCIAPCLVLPIPSSERLSRLRLDVQAWFTGYYYVCTGSSPPRCIQSHVDSSPEWRRWARIASQLE